MVCTCSQCSASDYAEPIDDSWIDDMKLEVTTPEQDRERLMNALRSVEASMPRPKRYNDILTEYQRRQGLSLAEWFEENKRGY